MTGAFPLMIFTGVIVSKIGDKTPLVKTFLGGGAIAVIFGSAALVAFRLLPEAPIAVMKNFMTGGGSYWLRGFQGGSLYRRPYHGRRHGRGSGPPG
jgi:Na+/citrate or Na+/malate symporter